MDKIKVCIYADETGLFSREFLDKQNLIDVELPEIAFELFFMEHVLESFRPTEPEEDTTNYGLYREWLDEFTADGTDGLWAWCKLRNVPVKIAAV